MALLSHIKESGFQALGRALRIPPLGRALIRAADRGPVPKFQILVYHRVLPAFDPFAISPVTERDFDRQMRLLRDCFRPVSLDRLVEELDAGKVAPGTVAVTFDDGYRDNHDHAWPILRRYGIPATIYLATGLIGTGAVAWYDKVLAALRAPALDRLTFAPAGMHDRDIRRPQERAETAYALLEWLKGFAPAERDAWIAEIAKACGPGAGAGQRLMLDWDEVRAMHRSGTGITFGAHTVNHPILSKVGEAEMEAEIRDSRAAMEAELQAPVRHFAYPNGKAADYTPLTMDILARQGFLTAVTTEPGVNRPAGNRFAWLRRQPWDPSLDSLYFRMLAERFAA